MPWCPRCDETFPEGPSCPRCSARLVARERGTTTEDALDSVPGLRHIRVSRRYLRAFDKLSTSAPSSSRGLVLALVLLIFAAGFVVGRMVVTPVGGPTIRGTTVPNPLPFDDVKGAVSYIRSDHDSITTIVLHDLFSGDVTPRAQLSPPFDSNDRVTTRVVSYGRSVAVVLSDGSESWVAFAPHRMPLHGWVPGTEAAWASESEILIRQSDGGVVSWSDESTGAAEAGNADQLLQTTSGTVARHGRSLDPVDSERTRLEVPKGSEVLAVAPGASRALLNATAPALWDGTEKVRVRSAPGRVLGASFEGSGEHVAILMQEKDDLTLAIVDEQGNAALKPLGNAAGCTSTPAWDASGRWVYVATDDGVLHAVEAKGGRVESIRTNGIGCGVAWLNIA